MIKFKSTVIAFGLLFFLTQCDSKIKNTTMQNPNTTQKEVNEIIVDVRTVEEWNEDGHAACSVNYPLDKFESKIEELKKYDKVILVCRSGNRAGIAKAKLQSAGYTKNIENLGPWQNVTCNTN